MRRVATAFVVSVVLLAGGVIAQQKRQQDIDLQAAMRTETVGGDLNGAIKQYAAIVFKYKADRAVTAAALVHMAECYQKLGNTESRRIYAEVVGKYADQVESAATARLRLASLGSPAGLATGKNTRLVWSGPDAGGALSPDGRYLSFQVGETGDLAVRDLTTGITRNLTNTGGWVASGDYVEESIISPDGKQVAYLWAIEKEKKNELRVIPIAASSSTAAHTVLRTERTDYVGPVAWTPDGRQLIVKRSQDRAWQIGTISIQNGSFRSLKSLEWRSPGGVSLSPDGRFLAYDVPAGVNGSTREIFLLATDGSGERPLLQDPASESSPFWSPDGSRLLFLSNRTGTMSLWNQSIAAGAPQGKPTSIKFNLDRVTLLGTSRSGALYYRVRGASRQNVYVADLDGIRVNRPPARGIASYVNANQGPAWSRDGQYLAYYSSHNPTMVPRPETSILVIKTVGTGVNREVPLPTGVENTPLNPGPKWFPDHRAVLILARDAQGPGLGFYRLDIDTARTDLLWHINHNTQSFDLSPDGKSIFCKGPDSLVRFDIDSRRETVLKKDEWFIALAVSPDGAELAYLKSVRENTREYPSVVEVMPAAGGPAREVYRHPTWFDGSRFNTLAWTPDQRFLLFVRGENGTESLWRVPVAGGAPEKVGVSSAGEIKTPAVRPDGKQIAFAMHENDDNEVWTLEHFLPAPGAKK